MQCCIKCRRRAAPERKLCEWHLRLNRHATRKHRGIPPEKREWYEHAYKMSRLRQQVAQEAQKQWIAHCGRWHPITAIPMTVPCCGAVVLRKEKTL